LSRIALSGTRCLGSEQSSEHGAWSAEPDRFLWLRAPRSPLPARVAATCCLPAGRHVAAGQADVAAESEPAEAAPGHVFGGAAEPVPHQAAARTRLSLDLGGRARAAPGARSLRPPPLRA